MKFKRCASKYLLRRTRRNWSRYLGSCNCLYLVWIAFQQNPPDLLPLWKLSFSTNGSDQRHLAHSSICRVVVLALILREYRNRCPRSSRWFVKRPVTAVGDLGPNALGGIFSRFRAEVLENPSRVHLAFACCGSKEREGSLSMSATTSSARSMRCDVRMDCVETSD
jgi:hypothetical protein